jgi:hypothetical protein
MLCFVLTKSVTWLFVRVVKILRISLSGVYTVLFFVLTISVKLLFVAVVSIFEYH